VLAAVRREKSAAKRSMRAQVALVTVRGTEARRGALESARRDLMDAGAIDRLELADGDDEVVVELAPEPAPEPSV
jgi:valyl-tRNA synthetase